MKKLVTLMLGLSFVFGTVAFAQEPTKEGEKKAEKKKKGSKKKKEAKPKEEPK